MSDIDALLKDFDQSKKTTKKENPPQQKLPLPNFSTFPKSDFANSDTRKGPIPSANIPLPPEQRRTSILCWGHRMRDFRWWWRRLLWLNRMTVKNSIDIE